MDTLEEVRGRDNAPTNEQLFNNPMVVNPPMVWSDYAMPSIAIQLAIRLSVIQANNFKLKLVTLQMI